MKSRVFITGATGFVGKRLTLRLAEENEVSALVRPQSLDKTNDLKKAGVEIITGDVLEDNCYSEKLKEIDYLFHTAALFKLDAPMSDLYKFNVIGTKNLFSACVGKNIKRIIYFSTAYVSGITEKDFMKEDEPYPVKFKNWYEWSKAEAEKVVLDFCKKYNLPVIIIRPVIIYGPENFYGFYSAMELIAKKKLWTYPGRGENKVHLVHIDDVVESAVYLSQLKNYTGEIFHICDNSPYTCSELIKFSCYQLNRKLPMITLPIGVIKFIGKLPLGRLLLGGISMELLDYFIYSQTYSNAKIKSAGYKFNYPSAFKGLESTINWYREHGYLCPSVV